jgi:hypothetical protein
MELPVTVKISGVYSGVTGISHHIEAKQYNISSGSLESSTVLPFVARPLTAGSST